MSPDEPDLLFLDGIWGETCESGLLANNVEQTWQSVAVAVAHLEDSAPLLHVAFDTGSNCNVLALKTVEANSWLWSSLDEFEVLRKEATAFESGQHSAHIARPDAKFITASDAPDCVIWSMFMSLRERTTASFDDPSLLCSQFCSIQTCRIDLELSLQGRTAIESQVILHAIYIVSISFHSLQLAELYDAVVNLGLLQGTFAREDPSACRLPDRARLMRLCAGLLAVSQNGTVAFKKPALLDFFRDEGVSRVEQGHESMVTLCFHYLKQARANIIKPWRHFRQTLRKLPSHPFLKYVLRYWPKHYRRAESLHNSLPAQLHQLLEVAVSDSFPKQQYPIAIRRMTLNCGLAFCKNNNFVHLSRLYHDMGACLDDVQLLELKEVPLQYLDSLRCQLEAKILARGKASHLVTANVDSDWTLVSQDTPESEPGSKSHNGPTPSARDLDALRQQLRQLDVKGKSERPFLQQLDVTQHELPLSGTSYAESSSGSTDPSSPETTTCPAIGRYDDLRRFHDHTVQQARLYPEGMDWQMVDNPGF